MLARGWHPPVLSAAQDSGHALVTCNPDNDNCPTWLGRARLEVSSCIISPGLCSDQDRTTSETDIILCLFWRSVGPPSDPPSGTPGPSTHATSSNGSQITNAPSTNPRAQLFDEWMRAKTAVLPGNHWTTLDGCYESYATRVCHVHSAVPLSQRALSAALRRALSAEAAAGRVIFSKGPHKSAIRGFFVDGVTVEPEALVEEWFHAKAAFDPAGKKWVPLATCFESFLEYFLPWCDIDRERWITVTRVGKNGFFRMFREHLAAAEAAGRVCYMSSRCAVKGLIVL